MLSSKDHYLVVNNHGVVGPGIFALAELQQRKIIGGSCKKQQMRLDEHRASEIIRNVGIAQNQVTRH